MKEAVQKHARDEFREDVWNELAETMHYVATDFADEGGEDELSSCSASSTRSAASAGTASTTSPSRRVAFPTIVDALGKRRSRRRAGRA